MLKKLLSFFLITTITFLPSCKSNDKILQRASQIRYDVYNYYCEDFNLTAYLEKAENPQKNDGQIGSLENYVTFKLQPFKDKQSSYSIKFNLKGKNHYKNFDYKQISSFLNCTFIVVDLPDDKFDVTICNESSCTTVTLSSLKNKSTKNYKKAIEKVCRDEDYLKIKNINDCELKIRLIDNDGCDYWYVGIISKKEKLSYLLEGDTLEIIAKKYD